MLSLGLGVTSSLTSVDALVRGVYSAGGVLPRVALDFDDNKYVLDSGDVSFNKAFMGTSPRLTYSTSSNSTMVNSSGEIVWAPHNLLEYSEDFTTGWSLRQLLPFGSGSVSNATTGPDDNATADLIVPNTASSNEHYIRTVNQAALATGAVGTFSVFVKAAGYTSLSIRLVGTDAAIINYDLTAVTADDAGGTIEFVGNSWYRCTITGTGTGTNAWPWIYPNQQATYAGDGTSGIYIYGAHLYRSDLGGMAPVPGAATGFETYVPTNGAAEYLPRVGHHVYNGSTWVNEGLLIESEARTNLVPNSNAFISDIGDTVVADYAAGPDGLTSATLFTSEGDAAARIRPTTLPLVTSGVPNTLSVFVKNVDARYVQLLNGGDANYYCNFDLELGTVGTEGLGSSGGIEDYGNGWYRIYTTWSSSYVAATNNYLYIQNSSSTNYGAAGATGLNVSVLVYGSQFEQASTPSSYIPTNGSTVTRGAQSLTVPPAEFGWPEPEYIGPELVDNGGFATDTDWTKGTGWTISGGTAIHAAGSATQLTQSISMTLGKVYQATCDVVACSGGTGSLQFRSGGTTTAATIDVIDVGSSVQITYVAEGNSQVAVFAGAGTDLTIDNISVREINPLSVSIQMDGRMTYIDDGDNATATMARWQLDSQYLQMRLRTDSTRTGSAYGVMNNGIATLGQDTNGAATDIIPGVLVPIDAATRFGSTFLNVAMNGTSAATITTPTALPDLSGTDLEIAYNFMGTIGTFRQFAGDIGDTGLVTATNPSTEPTLSLAFDGTEGSFYNLSWSQ